MRDFKGYVPSRLQVPPKPPAEKTCTRCGVTKPNDFVHFNKVIKKLTDALVGHGTTSVCKACKSTAMSDSWKNR